MKLIAILLCAVATAVHAGLSSPVIPTDAEISPVGILDETVRNILESLRPKIADLVFQNVTQNITEPAVNLTLSIPYVTIKDLDKFAIVNLDATLIPLAVRNLTVLFKDVYILGNYSLDATLDLPILTQPTHVYGNGPLEIVFHDFFVTLASSFYLSGTTVQIPKDGIYAFDTYIGSAKVNLSNLMGGGPKGDELNRFLSLLIPDLVRDYKEVAFYTYRETIINLINQYLAGN